MSSAKESPAVTSLDKIRRGLSATRTWGRLEITPETELSMTRRGALVMRVYPPGATRGERALLNARYRLSSTTGAGLLIFASILMAAALTASTPLRPTVTWIISAAALLLVAGTVTVLSSRAASKVRSVRFPLAVMNEGRGRAGVHIAAQHDAAFKVLMTQVQQLDRDAHRLNPVDYELHWGRTMEEGSQ